MSTRQVELALKKQRLLLECASQRYQLAEYAKGMSPVFSTADRVVEVTSWLRQHPAAVAASGLAIMVMRPRALWRLGWRGFAAWRFVRKLRSML